MQNTAVNALITFEEIVMVMIKGVIGWVISNQPSAISPELYESKSSYQLIVSIIKCENLF